MTNKKFKQLVAPFFITFCLITILVGYGILCVFLPIWIGIKIIGLIILGALAGVSVFVLVERFQEVRSGETDDLSKY